MNGRTFDAKNITPPECVQRLSADVPACFSSRTSWTQYLEEAWRCALDSRPERARMEAGNAPDYCSECDSRFRARMHAEGRCKPPADAVGVPALHGVAHE